MSEWILIVMFYSGYAGSAEATAITSIRFKSEASCIDASRITLQKLDERNKSQPGLYNGTAYCVKDK